MLLNTEYRPFGKKKIMDRLSRKTYRDVSVITVSSLYHYELIRPYSRPLLFYSCIKIRPN